MVGIIKKRDMERGYIYIYTHTHTNYDTIGEITSNRDSN